MIAIEDEDELVTTEEPEEDGPSPLLYDDDEPNLVRAFSGSPEGEVALKKAMSYALASFRSDWDSMRRFREHVAEDLRILAGELKPKTFPFEGCANAHVPVMLQNLSRLQSRISDEVFGDYSNVVGVSAVGGDDEQQADILSKHANWQMRNDVPDFMRQMDRAVLTFLLTGSVFSRSWYDEERKQNRHDTLMPDELCFPYTYCTTMPDLSDLPRYTWIRRIYRHHIEAMREQWDNVDKMLEYEGEAWDDEPEPIVRQAMDEIVGQSPQDSVSSPKDQGSKVKMTSDQPYVILEFHAWMRLPGQDRDRWCRVVFHPASQTVLQLCIDDEPDWRDVSRYTRQLSELESYSAQYQTYHQSLEASRMMATVALDSVDRSIEDGTPLDLSTAMGGVAAAQGAPLVPPPVPPSWMQDPDNLDEMPAPPRTVPVHMFAHGVCLENLVGGLGLGMGRIESDYNKAADTMLSQYIDAATVANASGWLVSSGMTFKDGPNVKIVPGKMVVVEGIAPGEIDKSIKQLQSAGANPQLIEGVDRMVKWGEDAIQAADVLSGQAGKSGETFRGLSSRLEQATKQLGLIAQRFCIFLKQVYRNNAKLNSIFMPDEVFILLMNDEAGAKSAPLRVGRALYDRDYSVEIRADLKFTSEQQRIAEADELVMLPQQVPALQSNFAFQYATVRRALEARGRHDLVSLLGEPPQAPQFFGIPTSPPAPPPGTPPPAPGGPPAEGAPNAPPAMA